MTGVVHLGQIQSGLRSAIRLVQASDIRSELSRRHALWPFPSPVMIRIVIVPVQGSHIKIHTNSELPVHVDGEPWIQAPGDIVVLKSALKVRREGVRQGSEQGRPEKWPR